MTKFAAALTLATALVAFTAPAFALGGTTTSQQNQGSYNTNTYNAPYGDVQTGTTSSTKQQRQYQNQNQYQNQYQNQQQYYQEQAQPQQQPAAPTASRVRLSGSGNNTARQAVIENDPDLLARVNAGQVKTNQIIVGRADLNMDGNQEVFAFYEVPGYCQGEFCPLFVYQTVRGTLTPVLQAYMTVNDIAVMDDYGANGWRSLVVYDQRGRQIVMSYNGREYVEPRQYGRRGGWR